MPEGSLYIGCTASAVELSPGSAIFQNDRIAPQLVRAPQPALGAALIAYLEARYSDDGRRTKNALCTTVPFPHQLHEYLHINMANLQKLAAQSA